MSTASELIDKARLSLIDLTRRNSLLNYRLLKTRGFELCCLDPEKLMSKCLSNSEPFKVFAKDSDIPPQSKLDSVVALHDATTLKTRIRKTQKDAKLNIEERGTNILFLAAGFLGWTDDESSNEINWAPLLIFPIRIDQVDSEPFSLTSAGDEFIENISLREKLRQQNLSLPAAELLQDGRIDEYLTRVEKLAASKAWTVDRTKATVSFFQFTKFQMYEDLDSKFWNELNTEDGGANSVLQALLEDRIADDRSSQNGDDTSASDRLVEEPVLVCDADNSQVKVVTLARTGKSFVVEGPPGTGKSQTITNLLADSISIGKSILFVAEKQTALSVVKRRLDEIGLGGLVLELHSNKANKRQVLDAIKAQLEIDYEDAPLFDSERYEEVRRLLDDYSDALNIPFLKIGLSPQNIFGELLLRYKALKDDLENYEGIREASNQAAVAIGNGESVTREGLVLQGRALRSIQDALVDLPSRGQSLLGESALSILTLGEKARIRLQLRDVHELLGKLSTQISILLGAKELETVLTLEKLDRNLNIYELVRAMPILSKLDFKKLDESAASDAVKNCQVRLDSIAQLKSYYSHLFAEAAWGIDESTPLEVLKVRRHNILGGLHPEVRGVLKSLRVFQLSGVSLGIEAAIGFLEAITSVKRLQSEIGREFDSLARIPGEILQDVNSQVAVLQEFQNALAASRSKGIVLSQVDDALYESFENKYIDISECRKLISSLVESGRVLDVALKINYFSDERARNAEFKNLKEVIGSLEAGIETLDKWVAYRSAIEHLNDVGLGYVKALIDGGTIPVSKISAFVEYGTYEALAGLAVRERPLLRDWPGKKIESIRAEYISLESRRRSDCKARVLRENRLAKERADFAQMGRLVREIHKKRNVMPLRKLFETCGGAIEAIKPIFMMSPLSVASYFPRTIEKFDLVVFDEASQIRPVDAFGAILRANQVMVVGDSQQLPPTNFFESLLDDEDVSSEGEEAEKYDVPVADVESILALMRAMRAPATDLRMHYRSRHESLIAVSNSEFYRNRLLVCPNPGAKSEGEGLYHHLVKNAVYDRGKSRTNLIEARTIAEFAVEHIKRFPNQSLGIVAFSVQQQEAIEFALDAVNGGREAVDKCNNENPNEPVFVRNLETVQGDERDVILISIGYGIDPDGRFTMNFGPLSASGGDKRLNVLISRAKIKCHVFSNFSYEQMDTSKTAYGGVEKLKTYLKFAQTGILDNAYATGLEPDSPFEEHVGSVIRALGYEIEYQVGTAGFRIDIGVRHPKNKSEYLLGIECDGATYHSSRSARQRDKVRQMLLEQRGWRLHRIWSTDWFMSQQSEEGRLSRRLSEATLESSLGRVNE
jgi:hypothetical protein